jgi:hypothetical protein
MIIIIMIIEINLVLQLTSIYIAFVLFFINKFLVYLKNLLLSNLVIV